MAERGLRDPDLRRLRALRMIEMRIKGASLAEVAQEFGVSSKTVAATLSWAKKAELVVEAEDRILRELVPAAQEALMKVLAESTDDDVKAKTALEIFKGTLPSFAKSKSTGAPSAGADSDLAGYIAKFRDGQILPGEVIDTVPGLPEGGPRALITAGEAESLEKGLSPAAESDGSAVESPRDASDSV